MKRTIKIAGAGLSGLVAGINLLKSGYRVVCYEIREDIGARFNNDFQGIANWIGDDNVIQVMKDINIEIDFLLKPFTKALFLSPGSTEKIECISPEPIFYLVRRGRSRDSIDYSLKKQFLKLGGEIRFNREISSEEADIIATGPKRAHIIAVGYTFETSHSDIACGVIDSNLAPGAYSYLLVCEGEATLAVVLSKDFKNQKKYLEKTVDAFTREFGLTIKNKRRFGGMGDFFLTKSAIKGGKLYTGEAAGFQDYLAEFGMFYALRSGFLAAKSIIEKKNYDELWQKDFGDFLKAGLVNRFLFEIIGDRSYKIGKKLIINQREKGLGLFKKAYQYDGFRKIIFPLAYFIKKKRIEGFNPSRNRR